VEEWVECQLELGESLEAEGMLPVQAMEQLEQVKELDGLD
jgi:hypothetical protein